MLSHVAPEVVHGILTIPRREIRDNLIDPILEQSLKNLVGDLVFCQANDGLDS
jgi:hypothetical protein